MKKELTLMANPSLSRQFTLTNFTWKLRANGHLKGEKIGAVNYLKLSRIPADIRIYWNSTNNRETAFSVDELVRGFKINERDEAGNAKTLDNVWLWSEGEIPLEPLSDIIEIEYNGAGDLIEPLLGNKSGAIDKIEKVQVVSAIDKILQPIKVVQQSNAQGYKIDDFYRINANSMQPAIEHKSIKFNLRSNGGRYLPVNFGFYTPAISERNRDIVYNANTTVVKDNHFAFPAFPMYVEKIANGEINAKLEFVKDLLDSGGNLRKDFSFGLSTGLLKMSITGIRSSNFVQQSEGNFRYGGWDSNIGGAIVSIPSEAKLYTMFSRGHNDAFLKCLEIVDWTDNITDSVVCKGEQNFFPKDGQVFGKIAWETTKDGAYDMFIFKTQSKTSYIAPANTANIYVSIIANMNAKNADFKLRLLELSKTSTSDCALYLGGLQGVKIPIKTGFELCFNKNKTGMDYAVIEIPAGDIYQIELELLNVYEDSSDA